MFPWSLVSGPFLGVHQSWDRGVPQSHVRISQSQAEGTPYQVGYPPSKDWGTPLARTGMGYPPGQDRTGVPSWPGHVWVPPTPHLWPGQDWGNPPPKTAQQSKYLLSGGRYACCVHTGGLSRYMSFFLFAVIKRQLVNSMKIKCLLKE